jgi:flagellar protein FliO/FliZ
MMRRFTYFAVLLCWSCLSLAADTTTEKTVPTPPLNTGTLFETLFGLLIVLGCIVLVAWLLKRTNRFHTSANGQLKIIAGLALGARERIVLVQVGEQQLLVGITSQQIQTLHVLDQPIDSEEATPISAPFAEKLNQALQGKNT